MIRLQDARGHNVNLILYGLWLAICEGARLDTAALARAQAAMGPLDRDVVAPLRRLRRALKADPDPDMRDLRRRVLAVEIDAERRVQARLASLAPRRKSRSRDRRALVEANLRLILGGDFAAEEAVLLRKSIAGL